MARFKYVGRDRNGKKNGVLNADSKREAMEKLKIQGIRVIDMQELPETFLTKEITIGKPVKLQHFVIFLRQFSTLIRSGVTIVDSTKILAEQSDSKYLRKVIVKIDQELREGKPFSEACSRHTKVFEPLFVNMIKAGEASGSLDETLEELAEYYEKQQHTKQKVISALAYPIVVAFIAIGVVIFLLVAVVPTFVSMFKDFGGELPAITQLVLNSSNFMQKYWYLIVFFIVLFVIGIITFKNNNATKYYFDYFLLRIPFFGMFMKKATIARMSRTLSSMFSSSVPVLEALIMVEKIVDNDVYAKVIRMSRDSLERGQSLAEPMKKHWAFPPLVSHMIAIGEKTGSLDGMLAKVADFYEKEVDAAANRLKSLIEPLMIVVLASLVGTIVTAIIVPMFDIYNNVQIYQ